MLLQRMGQAAYVSAATGAPTLEEYLTAVHSGSYEFTLGLPAGAVAGQYLYLQIDDNSDFSSVTTTYSQMITEGDILAGSMDLAGWATPSTNPSYGRARIQQSYDGLSGTNGDWSNTLTMGWPDAITFTDQTDVTASTQYESAPITLNIPAGVTVPIHAGGAEYQKNGGSWVTAVGTAVDNDTIAVRQTSSASANTATNVTFTAGHISDVFTVTTETLGWNPDSLWLASEAGDWWDASDLGSMWQDTGATSAVTAAGQVVKCWQGQRGNINLTDATGLTLRHDGTEYYLEAITASSNGLANASCRIVNASDGAYSFGTAVEISNTTGTRYIVTHDSGGGATRVHRMQVASAVMQAIGWDTAGGADTDSGNSLTATQRHRLITTNAGGTNGALTAWLDNASSASTTLTGAAQTSTGPLEIGQWGAAHIQCDYYKGLVCIGRLIDSTERGELDTWLT